MPDPDALIGRFSTMMMIDSLLFLQLALLGVADVSLGEPVIRLNDAEPYAGDTYLTYPYGACYRDGRLYVADEGQPVLIFGKDGFVGRIGTLGEAGWEFRNQPVRLGFHEDLLVVYERYRRSRSFFTLTGDFVRKETLEPKHIYRDSGEVYAVLDYTDAFDRGHMLEHLGTGTFMGRLEEATGIGFHLSAAIPFPLGDGRTLILKRRGAAEILDEQGRVVAEWALGVEAHKGVVERDPYGEALLKHVRREIRYYRFGLPVFGTAIERDEVVWLLVGDEDSLDKSRRPTVTTLYRCDLGTGRLTARFPLGNAVTTLAIHDDHLILVSQAEAIISVNDLTGIRRQLGE